MANSKHIIFGSGFSGLFSALLLTQRGFGEDTLVVEAGDEPGGLLRSRHFGQFGPFDYGTHNIQETGVAEIDSLLLGVLGKEEWNVLEGSQRDLGGYIRHGLVHHESFYVDLRREAAESNKLSQAFFEHVESVEPTGDSLASSDDSASAYLRNRFGPVASAPYLRRLEQKYARPAEDLSVLACKISAMERYVALDETETRRKYSEEKWRSVLGWPNQRTLPDKYSSGKKSFYPRAGGMQMWVDGAVSWLKSRGVVFSTSSKIESLSFTRGALSGVRIASPTGTHEVNSELLVWTAARKGLIEMLPTNLDPGLSSSEVRPERPLTTWLVHLGLLEKPDVLRDLHYVVDHTPGHRVHRVTNYSSFCPEMAGDGVFPLTVELMDPTGDILTEEIAIQRVFDEFLVPIGIGEAEVAFIKAIELGRGYPLPSLAANRKATSEAQLVDELTPHNILSLGSKPEKGIFFQSQIIEDAYEQIEQWAR